MIILFCSCDFHGGPLSPNGLDFMIGLETGTQGKKKSTTMELKMHKK